MTSLTTDLTPQSKSRELLRTLSSDHIAAAAKTNYPEDPYISLDTSKMGNSNNNDNNERSHRRNSQSSRSHKHSRRRIQNDVFNDDEESNNEYYTLDELVEKNIYKTRQNYAPFAYLFSIVQTLILIAMMIQCKIAPFQINPMVGPYPDALDYWGGKNAFKIMNEGENYRLLTPILLHAGLLHLVGNVAVQMDQGAFYEKEWGSIIWLVIYLSSAIGSSILSCCFMPNNVSVGSSGAVMGLFGAKLAEVFLRMCESDTDQQGRVGHFVRKEQRNETLCAVTFVMLFGFVPFVDWAAHLGGLLAGFCAGMVCFSFYVENKAFLMCWFVIGVGLTIAYYGITLIYMYNEVEPMEELKDVCGYYKQFFEEYECNCQLDRNQD